LISGSHSPSSDDKRLVGMQSVVGEFNRIFLDQQVALNDSNYKSYHLPALASLPEWSAITAARQRPSDD
jgi:hypothetical protein